MPKIKRGFSLSKVLAEVATSGEALAKAIQVQNPSFDQDGFTLELQNLVKRYGSGEQASLPAPTETAAVKVAAPPYNIAADFLCMAYSDMQSDDAEVRKKALKTVVAAFNAPGIDEIIGGLNALNASAEIPEVKAEADEDDSAEEVDETEGDEEESKVSDAEKAIADAAKPETAGDDSEEVTDDEAEEEEETASKAPLIRRTKKPEAATQTLTEQTRARLALANRMSIAGDGPSRRLGQEVLKD